MNKKIIFTKTMDVADIYSPKPSSTFLPEWYKKTQTYMDNKKAIDISNSNHGTIKKCIPVFDALTSGYIIPTYCDLYITKDENGEIIYMPAVSNPNNPTINFHPVIQAPYHPKMNQHPYPKWTNPWAIKTPKGYSSLFIPPVHGGNNYFSVAEGIVDTDIYTTPVNFPFVLNDVSFEGVIPAGTPMVQVIPIKRDSWLIEYSNDTKESLDVHMQLSSRFYDRYKRMFWSRKSYK